MYAFVCLRVSYPFMHHVMTAYVTQTTTSPCACLTFTPICLLKFINFSPARKKKKKNLTCVRVFYGSSQQRILQPSDPVSVLPTTTVRMLRDVMHYTQKHKHLAYTAHYRTVAPRHNQTAHLIKTASTHAYK